MRQPTVCTGLSNRGVNKITPPFKSKAATKKTDPRMKSTGCSNVDNPLSRSAGITRLNTEWIVVISRKKGDVFHGYRVWLTRKV